MAACSAFDVTLYVSKDLEMNSAATLAVTHSSLNSAPSQDLELGAMARIWASVMVFLVAAPVSAVPVSAVPVSAVPVVAAVVAAAVVAARAGAVVDATTGLDAAGVAESQPALASAKK